MAIAPRRIRFGMSGRMDRGTADSVAAPQMTSTGLIPARTEADGARSGATEGSGYVSVGVAEGYGAAVGAGGGVFGLGQGFEEPGDLGGV